MEKEKQKIILVVEDESSYQDILLDKLSRSGFKVIGARNGKEGLETAIKLRPDLILLDIEMPLLNGLTMLEKLRQEDWGSTVKVILLSAYQDTDKISEAMDLGAYDYFVKTEIEIETLVEKIKEKIA